MFEICQHCTGPLQINLFFIIAFWAFNTIMKEISQRIHMPTEMKEWELHLEREVGLSVKKTVFYLLTGHMLRRASYSPDKRAGRKSRYKDKNESIITANFLERKDSPPCTGFL